MEDEKDIKPILLDIVRDVANICDKENIRYFMLGGTFIGAIRHQGFIPWDDDIDIAMPREDYEKFLSVIPKKLPKNLKLSHYTNDKNTMENFMKILNTDYEITEKKGEKGEILVKNNVFVDILPYDNVPNHFFAKMIFLFRVYKQIIKTRIVRAGTVYKDGYIGKNILKKLVVKFNNVFYKKTNLLNEYKKLEDISKKYINQRNTKTITNFSTLKFKIIRKETFNKERLLKLKKYKFENIELYGIEDYDYYLKKVFGNYMELPPEEERVAKHINRVIKVN